MSKSNAEDDRTTIMLSRRATFQVTTFDVSSVPVGRGELQDRGLPGPKHTAHRQMYFGVFA